MKYTKDTDFMKLVMDTELSKTSKTMYTDRIRHLQNKLGKDMFSIIKDAKNSVEWIKNNYESVTSQKAYLSVTLSIFRHAPGLKEQLSDAYKIWFDAFTKVDKEIEARYKENEPTKKQQEGYVSFAELVKMRDSLVKGSEDRLLLGMYTYIKPLRADFNAVRLYKGTIPEDHEPNYIHMANRGGCTLYLTEYKTANKHGEYKKKLPKELCEEIHTSLEKKPREWLFVKAGGKPFDKSNSYIRYANRILQRLFERPLTLSLIRHAFVDTLDFNTMTIAEKEAIALEMRHTTKLQDQYRLIFNRDTKGKKKGGKGKDTDSDTDGEDGGEDENNSGEDDGMMENTVIQDEASLDENN